MTHDAIGTEFPEGEFTAERYLGFLWADATRNDQDAFRWPDEAAEYGCDEQLVPHEFALVIAGQAIETSLMDVEELDPDPEKGVFHAGQSFDYHQPLYADETYTVSGRIEDIERKEGSSGEFDLITVSYEATDSDGEPAFDSTSQAIFMR
jgi:acyl-CoA thioesterase FadM